MYLCTYAPSYQSKQQPAYVPTNQCIYIHMHIPITQAVSQYPAQESTNQSMDYFLSYQPPISQPKCQPTLQVFAQMYQPISFIQPTNWPYNQQICMCPSQNCHYQ